MLTFVVAAAETCTAMSADSVDLVYEYDSRRGFSCVFKQVSYSGRADTDVHFNEVRARDREEGNTRFARDRFGKEGLTRTGRAHKQYAVGNFCSEL